MSLENENLDKCFEVVSAIVDKAGDVSENQHVFNSIIERIFFVFAVDCQPLLEEQKYQTKIKWHWSRHWNWPGSWENADQHAEHGISTPLVMHWNAANLTLSCWLGSFNFSFIGEESTSEGAKCELTDSPTWIIDPVDGTLNFVHSFPHSCISIALLVNKQAEIAIIYNPVVKQLFSARRGQGAFYNGDRMHVSGQKDLSQALVLAEFGTSRDQKKLDINLDNMRKIIQTTHG